MVSFYRKPINMGLLFSIACILTILSFPINPLVIFKVINPLDIKALWYIGWIVWSAGMVLIGLSYYYIYIRKTKVLIKQGIYKVVRNPMYLGWILSTFIATFFLYPHWVFIVIGIPGVLSIYLISVREEISNARRFDKSYKNYIENVPRMNIILGIIRLLRRRDKVPY